MPKKIFHGDDARKGLLDGINVTSQCVRHTLGPKGRNTVVGKTGYYPTIINDGVSIIKEVDLDDKLQDLGVRLVREAAYHTNDDAGDGTTTTTLIAQELVKEGFRRIVTGVSPNNLVDGLRDAHALAEERLDEILKFIDTPEEIKRVATVSAGGDAEIGDAIAEAINYIGRDGLVIVEESKKVTTEVRVEEGMVLTEGPVSTHFLENEAEIVLERPWVLLTDYNLYNIADMVPLFEAVVQTGQPLLIICEDLTGSALSTLLMNKDKGIVGIKIPGFGDRKIGMLEDLAILTEATIISQAMGFRLSDVNLTHLGSVERAVTKKGRTVLFPYAENDGNILKRIKVLKEQMKRTGSEFEREKIQERIARLSGGVAVIGVGAYTTSELKDKKLRMEDALSATKSAIDEGVVAGAGTVYLALAQYIQQFLDSTAEGDRIADSDYFAGYEVLIKALQVPVKQLAGNSGFIPDVVAYQLMREEYPYGLNMQTGEYGDVYAMGIIEPTKVIRTALNGAISIASMLYTTEAAVISVGDDEEEPLEQF